MSVPVLTSKFFEIVHTTQTPNKPLSALSNLSYSTLIQASKHQLVTMTVKSHITVHKIAKPDTNTSIEFGADLRGADLENVTNADFDTIRRALYERQVIIFKDQENLSPGAQYELTRLFDPSVENYGHSKTIDAKRSILHPDLKTIPRQPQVPVADFEGLRDIRLKHPHHRSFHKNPVSAEDDRDVTRFYRWHIDAALYGLNPPLVTSLMAVKVPRTQYQTLRYDDGSENELAVPRGSTVSVSSYRMFDLLSEVDKAFVKSTKVQYAPHPYTWMANAKSRSDGLGLVSDGLELPY